MKIKQCTWTQ